MSPHEFLQSIWPSQGWYCIAVLAKDGSAKGFHFQHKVFAGIGEAAEYAASLGRTRDVYVTMHALKQPSTPNPDPKKKPQVRTHANMRAARCLFGDLDVGDDKPYKTRADGLAGLKAFLKATGLPSPSILSSGRGFHLFWILEDEIATPEWKLLALKLRALAAHHGFQIDPTRIDDQASVLRIPGTFHHKDPKNPQPVVMAHVGAVTPNAVFIDLLTRGSALLAGGLFQHGSVGEDDEAEVTPACTMQELGDACGLVRYAARNQATQSEPQWHKILGLVRFVVDPRKWTHAMSQGHPGYSPAATDEKVAALSKVVIDAGIQKKMGPTTCGRLAQVYGEVSGEICGKCWYKGNPASSPAVAATRQPAKAEQGIPDAPRPYVRLKAGGVMMMPSKPEELPVTICPHDLYPLRIIDDPSTKTKTVAWRTRLPLRGDIEFETPIAAINDVKQLAEITANTGLMIKYANFQHVRNYMSAYIAELQKFVLDQEQHAHLGWVEDKSEFVLPDVVISASGTKPAMVTDNVLVAARSVSRRGTLDAQVKLLDFYNRPEYIRHQFLITCSLAASIFYMTDQNGVIVNASGESGASKSTALYAGASLWGQGKDYTINGTNNGATVKARNERVTVLANLPICVDEITHMPRDEMKDLAMSITQPGHRIRLLTNGKERKAIATEKATMMICTSNTSLHDVLSVNNAAGTAGSMRVFEIAFKKMQIHSKQEADDFLRGMRLNYGNIGPAFVEYAVRHRAQMQEQVIEEMRRVDRLGDVDSAERYWSSVMASAGTASRAAFKEGLLPFNPDELMEWAIQEQLGAMRTSVATSYADPIDTLMAYMESIASELLVVNQGNNGSVNVTRGPRGELAGRLETDTRMLYLSYNGFKNYCSRTGAPVAATLAHFVNTDVASTLKFTLGRGSAEYNYGQSKVIAINLKHQLISGRKELNVVSASKVVGIK